METYFAAMNEMRAAVSKEKLAADLLILVRDAEELVKATTGDLSEKAKEARARLTATLESIKPAYARLEEAAKGCAHSIERCVQEHPYESLVVVFGLGLLVGLIIRRK
jgi:ElaB/YqjD/DUF883 family membrane-anchored ribosome-binding protein